MCWCTAGCFIYSHKRLQYLMLCLLQNCANDDLLIQRPRGKGEVNGSSLAQRFRDSVVPSTKERQFLVHTLPGAEKLCCVSKKYPVSMSVWLVFLSVTLCSQLLSDFVLLLWYKDCQKSQLRPKLAVKSMQLDTSAEYVQNFRWITKIFGWCPDLLNVCKKLTIWLIYGLSDWIVAKTWLKWSSDRKWLNI